MPSCRVDLCGPAWGRWRGSWSASRRLVCRGSSWVLEERGAERERWRDLSSALEALWPGRRVVDNRPWAIGFVGYEEAARLAGDLPAGCRDARDGAPRGWWMLEPTLAEDAATVPRAGLRDGRTPDAGTVLGPVSLADEAFRTGVERILAAIAAGRVYQVNLSRRFVLEGWRGGLEPFMSRASRRRVPGYLARLASDDGELVCASMELLLRRRGSRIESRPIKGTRPRGRDREADRRLAAELDADPKERAELAMIVDLVRNDLGRVAEVGSVRVADPGTVTRWSNLHHRSARVAARLRAGESWWRLLAALAPAGSVTGCPKVAAMQMIAELETVARGPYCGALGVVAGCGDVELALSIRTAWQLGGRVEFATGCGIVWGSDPAREERESRLKAGPWLELAGR